MFTLTFKRSIKIQSIFILIFLILYSCEWQDISADEYFVERREKYNQYKYYDYKKFKEELKSLAEYRLSLFNAKELKQVKDDADKIYKVLSKGIKNKNCHTDKDKSGLQKSWWTPALLKEVETAFREKLKAIRKRDSAYKVEDFLETMYSNLDASAKPFPYVFYSSHCLLISFKNSEKYSIKKDQLKKLKLSLAEGTRILVYYYPHLYEKLEFLFDNEEVFD